MSQGIFDPTQPRLMFNHQQQKGAYPSPITLIHPTDGSVQCHIYGGMTPLQYISARIAGPMAAAAKGRNAVSIVSDQTPVEMPNQSIARDSVAIARAVLQECDRVQKQMDREAQEDGKTQDNAEEESHQKGDKESSADPSA